jgi:hypothetical protein
MLDSNFDQVVTFVENISETDVVIMFANYDDISNYFRAMKNKNSTVKKFYIGSDFWVGLTKTLIFKTSNLLFKGLYQQNISVNAEYYLGSLVVKFGEEEESIT